MADEKLLPIDMEYVQRQLLHLLRTPSPTGRTDEIMQYLGEQLEALGLGFELTRRGAMIASIGNDQDTTARAVVVHADTIGCMVRQLKPNGRLAIVPIGSHNARFVEGARVTVFTDRPGKTFTGTVLPLKASGHAFGDEVDSQEVSWSNLEVRVDAQVSDAAALEALGIRVGDFVNIHAVPDISTTGFVNARHLDDKGGIAAALGALKAIRDHDVDLEVPAHLLITISEEVGHGASHGLHTDVAEMLSIDAAIVAPGQVSREDAVTVVMQDMTGPFDYHLTRRLIRLAEAHGIEHERDIFRHYRSDVAAAIEAGAETRAALIGFGTDGSHGNERTTLAAIESTAQLVALYLQTDLTFGTWDTRPTGNLADFPSRSVQPAEEERRLELDPAADPHAD